MREGTAPDAAVEPEWQSFPGYSRISVALSAPTDPTSGQFYVISYAGLDEAIDQPCFRAYISGDSWRRNLRPELSKLVTHGFTLRCL
jgi:hypothetical protein